MKINLGMADRVIRVVLAGLIVALFSAQILTGILGILMLGVAVVFAITGLIGFCPIYSTLGLCSKKSETKAN